MKDAEIQRRLEHWQPPADYTDPDYWRLQKVVRWINYDDPYSVTTRDNEYARPERKDDYTTWDAIIEAGRSYMVGSKTPMDEYLRSHSSNLTLWQRMAYDWCKANPNQRLVVENARYEYHVYLRGEFVEIGLPYHGQGGERHWVTRDGKRKVLVNVD